MKRLGVLKLIAALGLVAACVTGCAHYDTVTETREEEIPYETIEEPDDTTWEGDTVVVTAGEPGLVEYSKEVTYKDGEWESETPEKETILAEPVDEVVRYGTKQPATGKEIPFEGAVVTISNVERASTARFASGESEDGDFLVITYRVDNSQGNSPMWLDAGRTLLTVGEDFVGYDDDYRGRWMAGFDPSATDGSKGIAYAKGGETVSMTVYYDLSPGSIRQNDSVASPQDVRVYLDNFNWDEIDYNAMLSEHWLKAF